MNEAELKKIQENHERFKREWTTKSDEAQLQALKEIGILDEQGDLAPAYRSESTEA